MSKKNQNGRLNSLFSHLGMISAQTIPVGEALSTGSVTWEMDAEGRFVSCGKDFADLMGVIPEQITGKSLTDLDFTNEDQSQLNDLLNLQEFPFDLELHFHSPKSEFQTIHCTFSSIRDEKDGLTGILGVATPINDGKDQLEHETSLDDFLTENIDEVSPLPELSVSPQAPAMGSEPESQVVLHDSLLEMPATTFNSIAAPEKDPGSQTTSSELHGEPALRTSDFEDSTSQITVASEAFKLAKTAPLGPLPASGPNTMVDGIAIKTTPIAGISFTNEKFQSAENVWTQEALNSFNTDSVISNEAYEDTPAVLASPLSVRNVKAGVVELVDVSPDRVWTEDDRQLLQEVTKQLGLALENAQLYSAVSKELTERVKAEEETLRRNRDLATLNSIGQRLSSLVSREQIFSILSSSIQQMLSSQNLLITMVNRDTNILSFPVCVMNNETIALPDRPFSHGYQEIVLNKRSPMLIQSDAVQVLSDSALDHPGGIPQSLLAVPLLAGDRSIGVISVFDFSMEFAFDQVQQELLSTIASQTATSLENANLFAEIRHALEIIEVRERFQANVTRAVATLSEQGIASTPQVLEFLSAASLCQRVYYVIPEVDSKNAPIWRVVSLFETPALQKKVNLSRPEFISISAYSEWLNSLQNNGFYSCTAANATPPEQAFLKEYNTQSLLLLAIPGQDKQTGFIAFENHSEPHNWAPDEISVLRIASDAYTNTLIREGLLSQLQTSLEETANLYSASHKLALANTMPEMITAVLSGENVQEINRGVLSPVLV